MVTGLCLTENVTYVLRVKLTDDFNGILNHTLIQI